MGKSKTTQNNSQTRDPYAPAKPGIDQSLTGVQDWLKNPSSFAAYDGDPSKFTTAGINTLGNSTYGKQALDHFSDVAGGKYLNADNPWQADLDRKIKASVMPSVNSTFSNAGMTGSTLHQGALTEGLTSGLAAPRYQHYQFERGNQDQAAGLLPDIETRVGGNQLTAGGITDANNRAKFDEERLAGLRPYLETAGLLQGYGNIGGTSSGTTTTGTTPSLGSQILGGGMMLGGLAGGAPGLGMIGQGIGNTMKGAPWSYGSSWSPWTQGA
jgi:hypothetical protein